jgi:antirestriction protein ArdC
MDVKHDLYRTVTAKIVADMETAEAAYWERPWFTVGSDTARPRNALTGAAYRGVNILSLWAAAAHQNFDRGDFATYHQWSELGAQVRKGEKGSLIVFYKTFDRESDEETKTRHIAFAKASYVFNVAQVDGAKLPDPPVLPPLERRIEAAEKFIANTKAVIHRGGNRACYIPGLDQIIVPISEQFKGRQAEFATVGHELTHWSGAPQRLARDLTGRFGDDKYAAEEIIAELGSAFTCVRLGITPEPRPDHAAYLPCGPRTERRAMTGTCRSGRWRLA